MIRDLVKQLIGKALTVIIPEVFIVLGMAGTIMLQFFPATHKGFNVALSIFSVIVSGLGFWAKGKG